VCFNGALYPGFNLLNIMKRSSPVFLRNRYSHVIKNKNAGCTTILFSKKVTILPISIQQYKPNEIIVLNLIIVNLVLTSRQNKSVSLH
jgi:hypothetical protein